MTLVRVASTKLRSTSGNTASASIGTVGASSALVAGMDQFGGANGDLTITDDSGSNTWTALTSAHSGTSSSRIAHCLSAANVATTVTFTRSSTATAPSGDVTEFSHTGTLAIDQQNRQGNASSTTANSPSVTTTAAVEFVYTHMSHAGNPSMTENAGFSLATQETDGATYEGYDARYTILSSTAAVQGQWTLGTAQVSSASIVTISESGGATTAFKDATARIRVAATAFRDATIRIRTAATNWRDSTARVRVAATAFKDATARIRTAATAYRDSTLRLVVQGIATGYRDATLRVRAAVRAYRDATLRVGIRVQAFKDATLRVRTAAPGYRFATLRIVVDSGIPVRDMVYTVGLPGSRWQIAAPRSSWTVAAPGGRWIILPPRE